MVAVFGCQDPMIGFDSETRAAMPCGSTAQYDCKGRPPLGSLEVRGSALQLSDGEKAGESWEEICWLSAGAVREL